MPATGSSSSSSFGSIASARPSSTRFCTQQADREAPPLLDLEEVDEVLHDGPVLELLALGPPAEPQGGGGAVADVGVPAEHQVVHDREVLEQLDVLERPGHAHLGDVVRRAAEDVLAEEAHLALLGSVHAREHVEDRGLAGAVGPDDREQLVLADLEVAPVDRLDAGEGQVDVAELHDRCGRARHACSRGVVTRRRSPRRGRSRTASACGACSA
jgi:hypothetical protein